MGTLTTAYSIPKPALQKIQKNKRLVERVFRGETDWSFPSYACEEAWEGKIRIIGKCHPIARNRLFLREYWNYPSADIWTVRPAAVQAAAQDMARANYASLERWGIRNGVFTDLYGDDIPAELFSYYVGDIEPFREFVSAAASSGHYLLFATR